jgi:hypothetical protein
MLFRRKVPQHAVMPSQTSLIVNRRLEPRSAPSRNGQENLPQIPLAFRTVPVMAQELSAQPSTPPVALKNPLPLLLRERCAGARAPGHSPGPRLGSGNNGLHSDGR